MKQATLLLLITAAGMPGAENFDRLVRGDFFAGFGGDQAALARAMKKTEEVLKTEPKHPEALVWHGSSLFFQSGRFFQSGDLANAREYWDRGLAEMDEGVKLAPDSISVRATRGGLMIQASRSVPDDMRDELLTRGLDDYQRMWALQQGQLAQLAEHPKGELMLGLADLLDRSGQAEKSKELVRRAAASMPATVYGKRAQQWLDTGALPVAQRSCIGCHASSGR